MLTAGQIAALANEIRYVTARSGGKGGQHVNKVESKVQATWKVKDSAVFTEDEKAQILVKVPDGILQVSAQESRSQMQNKEQAFAKLLLLLKRLLHRKKKRKATKMPKAAKEKKLKTKKIRSLTKQNRQKPTI